MSIKTGRDGFAGKVDTKKRELFGLTLLVLDS